MNHHPFKQTKNKKEEKQTSYLLSSKPKAWELSQILME